jgi:DNA-binding NarL/FixJ family response regulator
MKTVMLVEDHMVVRVGYQRLLESSGYFKVVVEAVSGEEAVALYKTSRPDLVLMDVSLPNMDGIDALKRIRSYDQDARILIISLHDNVLLAEKALESGALGYVTKSSSGETIIKAAENVVNGSRFISPDIAEKIALKKIDGGVGPLMQLTRREQDIFLGMAEGKSIQELAAHLHVSDKTISNNVSNIKNKLGLKTAAEFVHLAMQYDLLPKK